MRKYDPLKKVVKASRESFMHFSRGLLNGSKGGWRLKLECGHETTRITESEKEPKSARCRDCGFEERKKASGKRG